MEIKWFLWQDCGCCKVKTNTFRTFHIVWRWRILHFHDAAVLLFGDEGYQVRRIQFFCCKWFVLEFISWFILFYGVWSWIVTHGSKTQIEAKIKPRGQLWEKKTPQCDVLDVKNLDQVHQIFPPLTANGSVDATSYIFQHPDISLCQKSAALCFDKSDIVMLDALHFYSPRNIHGIKAFYWW